MKDLKIDILPGRFAICRLDANADVPQWARGEFVSITRASDELSIVCPEVRVPAQIPSSRDWRCLKIAGPLDLAMIGVLANLTGVLAEQSISVFAISTFDTDYLLVKEENIDATVASLSAAGHRVTPIADDGRSG